VDKLLKSFRDEHKRLGETIAVLESLFFMFVVLHDVWGDKRLFEAAINLAQFPEDQNKENRDHEQQELDDH